jgi:NADPH:quinone reductase-like Zn-dependent oxidoreductase
MNAMGLFDTIDKLGVEGSGIVRRVGSNVTNLQVGDEVMVVARGLFQTRKTVRAKLCLRIPANISLEEGASMLIICGTVIYSLLHLASLRAGQVISRLLLEPNLKLHC